jgi:hypothetical protein
VILDTVRQIESHLVMHHYDGFLGARQPHSRASWLYALLVYSAKPGIQA